MPHCPTSFATYAAAGRYTIVTTAGCDRCSFAIWAGCDRATTLVAGARHVWGSLDSFRSRTHRASRAAIESRQVTHHRGW